MFVTSLLPTSEEGRTPTVQNRGQKSRSYNKTAPRKPFSGLALALLDAVFLLECFWLGLSLPPPPPSLWCYFLRTKKKKKSVKQPGAAAEGK